MFYKFNFYNGMILWKSKIIAILALLLFVISVFVQVFFNLDDFLAAKNKTVPVGAESSGQTPIISVDFAKETGTISDKIFGQGVEMPFLDNIWDKGTGFDQNTLGVAKAIKFTNLRFGGATCRTYNWKNEAMTGYRPYQKVYWEGIDQWYQYAKLLDLPAPTICTNIHLNPQDSADWVRYANIEKKYDIINWEMGNEEYLAYTKVEDYLRDARAHCTAMKAVDPRIKCGVVGDDKAVSWSNAELLSAIKPGDFDFFVAHFYEPESYYNYYSLYMNSDKYEKKVNLKPGRYRFTFQAIGDQAPETADPVPTLQVCFDKDCSWIDVTNTERGKWIKYSTREYDVKAGTHTIAFNLADDYYGWTSRQDKNIFMANVGLENNFSDKTELDFVDTKAWTYSFLASNLSTEDSIKEIRTLMEQRKLSMPIFITEYGWSYGVEAYPDWGQQYDWRSTLFDVLHIQSLIKESIPQANIWKDLSTGYWKYFSDDIKGQNYWPIFSVFKLLSEKTGNVLVETKIENVPTYNAQKFQTEARENIPYLSIVSSKNGSKNYINVVNRSQDKAILATIRTNIDYNMVRVAEIAPSSMESHPYRDDGFKENITTQEKVLNVNGDFNYNFKPFSVTTFEFNITAPLVSGGYPASNLAANTKFTTLRVSTDKPATCRYGLVPKLSFVEMSAQPLVSVTGMKHTVTVPGLKNGQTYTYYIKCQNAAGASNSVDYLIKFKVDSPGNPTSCLVAPDGGNHFRGKEISLTCGQSVVAASYQWDQGAVVNFKNSTSTWFAADKKRVLKVKYRYQTNVNGKMVEKAVSLNKIFEANQRYCNISPDGGVYGKNINIFIECGKNVKRSTWRWGNGTVYNFSPSTDIKFVADFSKNLNIAFAYDLVNGKGVEERVVKFSKIFRVPQCVDSDKGKNDGLKGTLTYTGQTIKRNYTDFCVGNVLTEYYCNGSNLMAFVKIHCPAGCNNGSCVKK